MGPDAMVLVFWMLIFKPVYSLYSKAKSACYSRCFLTSHFCSQAPYNEKDIFFEC